MRKLFGVTLAVVCVVFTAPIKASADCAGTTWTENAAPGVRPNWVNAALDIIIQSQMMMPPTSAQAPRWGGVINWYSAPFDCDGVLAAGCQRGGCPTIEVLGNPLRGPDVWNTALAHEMGHYIAATHGDYSGGTEQQCEDFSNYVKPAIQNAASMCWQYVTAGYLNNSQTACTVDRSWGAAMIRAQTGNQYYGVNCHGYVNPNTTRQNYTWRCW